MTHMFKKIDHVQLTAPTGSEYEAREFYAGMLGMEEVKKPESLEANGGFGSDLVNLNFISVLKNPIRRPKKLIPLLRLTSLMNSSPYWKNIK